MAGLSVGVAGLSVGVAGLSVSPNTTYVTRPASRNR